MGKGSVWTAVFMMAALLVCGACTKHDYPSCTDEQVTKIMLEKTREMSRDLYLGRTAPANLELKQAKGSYELLKERMEKKDEPRRDEIRKVLSKTDDFIAKMAVDLTGVKLTRTYKNSDTSLCSGTIVFTNKETKKQSTASVHFTAQYIEGHKLKVEWTR